jgi:hypothetical protein
MSFHSDPTGHSNPADGLLTQGAPGYQLTWMDAKVGDLVVTPRRGKVLGKLPIIENHTEPLQAHTSTSSQASVRP